VVDIKDVPRDPVLLGLPVAVDPEAMRRLLAPHFPQGVELLQVKVGRFTYKPGRNARFAYRLKLLDRSRGAAFKHVMHGRMETLEEAERTARKMRRRTWIEPAYGPALLHLEDIGVVLWGFPNDPRLPGIETVARSEAMLECLRAIPSIASLQPNECRSSIVKYVPGKRLVMKHRLSTDTKRRLLLYTKTYAHGGGEAIHAVMRSLWEHAAGDPNALVCPEPLAWLPDLGTLVLRALPGTSAVAQLDAGTLERDMIRAGHGLARIHASGVRGLQAWRAEDEHENFVKATRALESYDPELGPLLERLRTTAAANMSQLEEVDAVPIHGAFRFTQLLSHRDRLALVDFDGFKQGHPMCDAGGFVAHLYYLNAKRELDAPTAEVAVRAFLNAYREAAPWSLPERALRWYVGVLLVAKHVQKCVKRLKDDGDTKIRHMLDLAERVLDGDRSIS
jgi:aminoglycoside phosphotransferase (APT) family kinase protein